MSAPRPRGPLRFCEAVRADKRPSRCPSKSAPDGTPAKAQGSAPGGSPSARKPARLVDVVAAVPDAATTSFRRRLPRLSQRPLDLALQQKRRLQTLSGPLTGTRIIEVAGIGPGPFCVMMLADMGAEIIRVDRASNVRPGAERRTDILGRSRQIGRANV